MLENTRSRLLSSLALALCLLAPSRLPAAPSPAYRLSLSTETGFLQGEVLEIVYNAGYRPAWDYDHVMSRLDWGLGLVPFLGSRLELEAQSGLYASLGLRSALPGRYGSMEDRDWLNGNETLTHYSRHDNYLERALFAELAAGWELRAPGRLSFRLGLGLELMNLKWTGRDGYLQYPSAGAEGSYVPWAEGDPVPKAYGTGLAYEQLHLVPSLELGADWALSEDWRLSAGLGFSTLAYCQDLDNHFMRFEAGSYVGMEFAEWMYGGLFLEPELALERRLGEGRSLLLGASYRILTRLRGFAQVQYNGIEDWDSEAGEVGGPFEDSGGAKYSALSLGLALKMEL